MPFGYILIFYYRVLPVSKIKFIFFIIFILICCNKNNNFNKNEKDIIIQQKKENIQNPVNNDVSGEYFSETGKEMLKINYLEKEKKYEFIIYVQIMTNYEGEKESELYMTMHSKNTDLIEDQTGDKTWLIIEHKLSKTSYGYQFYEKEIRLTNQISANDNSTDIENSFSSSSVSSMNVSVDKNNIKEKMIDFYRE